MDSYHVGSGATGVTLSVAVSTPGIADTDPALVKGATSTDLNCISGPTGNLNNVPVGLPTALQGQNLQISTLIDLQSVSSGLWPTMFSSLVIHYSISGGADGTKVFTLVDTEKSKDTTGQFVKAIKTINLVQ